MGTSLVSSNPPLDTTLTKSGQAADAKAVGDELTTIRHKLECGEGEIPAGEEKEWSFIRVNYKYQHNITPIPVAVHSQTNTVNTALTIYSYNKEGFTVGAYDTTVYHGFLWIAVEPD